MNTTFLYGKVQLLKEEELNNLFKTTDDIMAHFDDLTKSIQKLIGEECDNPNNHAKEIRELANKAAERLDLKLNLSNFSKSEKKQRQKTHDLAKEAISVGITKAVTYQKIFENTCVVKQKGDQRTYSVIMAGLFRSAQDGKDVIEAINYIYDPKNNNQEEIEKKQEFLNGWFNNRIKDITKKINGLCYEQSDLEAINFAKNNFPFIASATEFQGENVKIVAKALNIKLDDNVYKEFRKVNDLLVDLGFSITDRVGNMANPLYTEFTKDDVQKISTINNEEKALDDDDRRRFDEIYTEKTKNDFKGPFEQYDKNPGRTVESTWFEKEVAEHGENFRNSNNPDLFEEEKELAKQDSAQAKIKSMEGFYIQAIAKFMPYLDLLKKDRTNGEGLSYSFNGKPVNQAKAITEALKGNRVQVYEDSFDLADKPNGKYLFTLQISQTGVNVPVNTGKALEWNYNEAKEAAELNSNLPKAEKRQIFIENTNGKLKENLDTLYNNLKAGSRFWISSNGEYGQLMKQIDECRKGDFTNRDQLHNRIDSIKKTASDYFMKRLEKTDRSALAIQREEAVEKVLNTFGNEYDKVREIEAAYSGLAYEKKSSKKKITTQSALIDSLRNDTIDDEALIPFIKENENDDFDKEKAQEEIFNMMNHD